MQNVIYITRWSERNCSSSVAIFSPLLNQKTSQASEAILTYITGKLLSLIAEGVLWSSACFATSAGRNSIFSVQQDHTWTSKIQCLLATRWFTNFKNNKKDCMWRQMATKGCYNLKSWVFFHILPMSKPRTYETSPYSINANQMI